MDNFDISLSADHIFVLMYAVTFYLFFRTFSLRYIEKFFQDIFVNSDDPLLKYFISVLLYSLITLIFSYLILNFCLNCRELELNDLRYSAFCLLSSPLVFFGLVLALTPSFLKLYKLRCRELAIFIVKLKNSHKYTDDKAVKLIMKKQRFKEVLADTTYNDVLRVYQNAKTDNC